MKEFQIDLTRDYLLIKMSVNNPVFMHLYVHDNKLKTWSIQVDCWETEDYFEEYMSKISVGKYEYLVEYTYENNYDYRIRKKILKHDFSESIAGFDAREFTAKLREEKINQILED